MLTALMLGGFQPAVIPSVFPDSLVWAMWLVIVAAFGLVGTLTREELRRGIRRLRSLDGLEQLRGLFGRRSAHVEEIPLSATAFVPLRSGREVPYEAIELVLSLESEGFQLRLETGEVVVNPAVQLTPARRRDIRFYHTAIVWILSECEPDEISGSIE